MLSMGQRRAAAPSFSRRWASSSCCRPSARAMVFPESGNDMNGPAAGVGRLPSFYGSAGERSALRELLEAQQGERGQGDHVGRPVLGGRDPQGLPGGERVVLL